MTEERFTAWRRSSRSAGGTDNCVEVAFAGDVGVRDSKRPHDAVLVFGSAAWAAFMAGARAGKFSSPFGVL